MASFWHAFENLMNLEGSYSSHPADPGGETAWGISSRWYPEMWTNGPPSRSDAEEFYHRVFWEPLSCSEFPQRIAGELLEAAVNCGTSRAASWLQASYNMLRYEGWPSIAEDGVVGPRTLAAVERLIEVGHENALYRAMNYFQAHHYASIANRDFMRGWFGRRLE